MLHNLASFIARMARLEVEVHVCTYWSNRKDMRCASSSPFSSPHYNNITLVPVCHSGCFSLDNLHRKSFRCSKQSLNEWWCPGCMMRWLIRPWSFCPLAFAKLIIHSAWPKLEPALVAADHVTARLMQELWYLIPSTKKDVCTCTGTFHHYDKGFNNINPNTCRLGRNAFSHLGVEKRFSLHNAVII